MTRKKLSRLDIAVMRAHLAAFYPDDLPRNAENYSDTDRQCCDAKDSGRGRQGAFS